MFQDGMVLQRNQPVRIWGTATPGKPISIRMGKWKASATANKKGEWQACLPEMKAGGPYILYIGDKQINDVLVGDVWLCGGQSNMDLTVARVYPQYSNDIDSYSNDRIRLLRAEQRAYADSALHEITTNGWSKASKNGAWNYSALGYFLARKMYEATGVPQGVICNSWGGTPIEAWVPRDSLLADYPVYCAQTAIHTPEYVKLQQQANSVMLGAWQQELDAADSGMAEGWANATYNDRQWSSHKQFADTWSEQAGRPVTGSVWMRQHISIDAAHAKQEALLNLGTLYDMDQTFVNGKQVGVTYYQYPPRRYRIPEGLLKEGDNVVAIRFITKQGAPAFTSGKSYRIEFADSTNINLTDTWLSRIGAQMPPCHTRNISIQNLPYILYNSMLRNIAPYNVAGTVWYQGESNTGKAAEYLPMLRKLKGAWRTAWHNSKMPFVIVQLANFMKPQDKPQNSQWAAVREAQRIAAEEDPMAELAVTIDLGEWNDIHPLRKREAADRAALALGKLAFRQKAVLSPKVTNTERVGESIILTFSEPLQEGKLNEFELAGAEGVFCNAKAEAKGSKVTISCAGITNPAKIRYAWKDNPDKANCIGKNGLPASPFMISAIE